MDIQFIELEHRENVLKIMEICGVEMKQAYELYLQSNFNFQAAINKKFGVTSNIPAPPVPQNNYPSFNPVYQQNDFYQSDIDYEYQQYKKMRTSGLNYQKKYPTRKTQGLFKSFIPSFFKSQPQDSFKTKLQSIVGKRINLKNNTGSLSESFQWSYKQKFPLAIIILNFSSQSHPLLKKVFSDDHFVQKIISEQYRVYGINAKQYDLQVEFKKHFNLTTDVNAIIISRVNVLDEVHIVSKININENIQEMKKKIKQAKSICIQAQLEDSNIIKQFNEERRGNFNYVRPRSIKQNIKLRQDKKLRKQQEQQYFKASMQKKQQKLPSQIKKQQKIYQNKKIQQKKIQQPPKKIAPKRNQGQIKKQKQIKFQKLSKYQNGIRFKIRVPSGQNYILIVDGSQKVQYLFDFIANHPQDLGFNDQLQRNFDIFQGFGGSQKLKGKETSSLRQLFEDSEVLIVREIQQ